MPLWRHLWWARTYFNVRINFKEEKVSAQHDVEIMQLKEENEQLRKEENDKVRKEDKEKLRSGNEQLRRKNEQSKEIM